MVQKDNKQLTENELRRQARIAVLKLKYNSLRDYELAMYRKAVAEADKLDKQPKAA